MEFFGVDVVKLMGGINMFFFKKKKTEINTNPKTGSFFRDWVIANDVNTKLKKTKKANEETVYFAFMGVLGWFGKETKKRAKETGEIYYNPKLKDAALFEFAVFLYLNIDMWLFNNNRSKRNLIADYLREKFLELSLTALPTHEVTQIFDNRLDFYGGLIRDGKFNDILEHYLPELIGLTLKDNTLNDYYNPDGVPLLMDAMESFRIKTDLGMTTKHGMEFIVRVLKDYK